MIFHYFSVKRKDLGSHFEGFWDTGVAYRWFLRVLETRWNFDGFRRDPRCEGTGFVEGDSLIRGGNS